MTIGNEFIQELKQRGKGYQYFKYGDTQQLKAIDSLDELHAFLSANGFGEFDRGSDVDALAYHLAARQQARRSRWDWVESLHRTVSSLPILALLLLLALPAICVNRLFPRQQRLQLIRSDILAYVALVAVAIAYEVFLATSFGEQLAGFPYRLAADLALAALCGVMLYTQFRKLIWISVSLGVVVQVELMILLARWLGPLTG